MLCVHIDVWAQVYHFFPNEDDPGMEHAGAQRDFQCFFDFSVNSQCVLHTEALRLSKAFRKAVGILDSEGQSGMHWGCLAAERGDIRCALGRRCVGACAEGGNFLRWESAGIIVKSIELGHSEA